MILHRLQARFLVAVCATLFAAAPVAGAAPGLHVAPDTLPWAQVGEWSVEDSTFDGNRFDVRATATFTHLDSGETIDTDLFYAGDDRWSFRFSGTRTGRWTFVTDSDDADLDGFEGSVDVTAGAIGAKGFLRAEGDRLVVPIDDGRETAGVLYNVYMPRSDELTHVGQLPSGGEGLDRRVDETLDQAEEIGLPSVLVAVLNNWFSFGAPTSNDHDSVDPDLATFDVLDTLILRAHARGMWIHLWMWGDHSRRQTPRNVGGIEGENDRRLQRYIAARLGPVPGWTMSYGFDLEEWVTPDEVRAWADRLHRRSGWPVILTARELGTDGDVTFRLGSDRLDLYSTDDRPEDGFYEVARERLGEGLPVLFERRFLYRRDGVWDADTTRRALWQFTMAGGAGAVWGRAFDDPRPYPNPEQFQIFERFWRSRWTPTLRTVDGFEGMTLSEDDDRFVIYAEDTDRVTLPLPASPPGWRGVAVDTRADSYREITIDDLDDFGAWSAPTRSDWALELERD